MLPFQWVVVALLFFKNPGCSSHVSRGIAQAQTLLYLRAQQGAGAGGRSISTHGCRVKPGAVGDLVYRHGLTQRELLLLLLRQFGL